MLRWSSSLRLSLRYLHTRVGTSDSLLDQLKNSTNKYHVFQLVGVHRPKLTLEHATCAMNLLLRFHKRNSKTSESVNHIQKHPEFVSLCAVVENNIDSMDDRQLVNILSIIDRFQVEAHSSLMQRLVTEGWRRLQRLDPKSLSTFAACLGRQGLTTSPLMGQIANIIDGCLDNIEDPVTISSFTSSLYAVSSPHLWDRLIKKTESSLDKLSPSHFHNLIELLEVIGMKRADIPLVKKCDKLLYNNADALGLQITYSIMRIYSHIHLFNCEFVIKAKSKLLEEVNRCDQPDVFANLFVALYRHVSFKIRDGLEKKLLSMEHKMCVKDLYDVLKIMEYAECKNLVLIQKICSRLRKDFHACSSKMLVNIVQAAVILDMKDYRIRAELQTHLKRHLFSSFVPTEVAYLLRALCLLRSGQLDDVVLSKLHDVIGQSNLHDLSLMTSFVTRLPKSNTLCSERLLNLQKQLYSSRLERLNGAKCLDSILYKLEDKDYFSTMNMELRKATLQTCQRLIHQVNRNNVAHLSRIVLQINMDCSPLLERIAAVTLDNIDKFSPSVIYPIVSVFSYMNLKPSQGDDFFNACAQLILNKIDSLSPYYLVLTVYSLVIAGYFPKELINAVFNNNFLLHFDNQLDTFANTMSVRLRNYLMQLNRAVCIEHPEYGVPWFHEHFCQQMLCKAEDTNDQLKMLLEPIFGDTNYAKMSVRTPYYYTIAFEYILDKNKNPIAYVDVNAITPDSSSVFEPGSQIEENKLLPEGAQRVAVDVLNSKAFLQNSNHVKGLSTMKKKHLEILGYQVVQIPYSELKDFASFQNLLPGNIASGNVC